MDAFLWADAVIGPGWYCKGVAAERVQAVADPVRVKPASVKVS